MGLEIPDGLKDALKRMRDDKSADDFAACCFDGEDSLKLLGSGSGGIQALREVLVADDVCYGIVRKTVMYEKVGTVQTDSIKFIFIMYLPDSIPLKRKMKMGKYEGTIKKLFQPYHSNIEINTPEEADEDGLVALIGDITMTASKVTDKKGDGMYMGGRKVDIINDSQHNTARKLVPDSRADFGKVAKGANVTFEDMDAVKEALNDVRDDNTDTTWCLVTYSSKKSIAFNNKGTGDVSDMLRHCVDTNVSYGLLRITEQIDQTVAVKFVYIVWSPPHVAPMEKAAISTHKGTVNPIFQPYHIDFTASEPEDISMDIINERVTGLSGTRSHVTEKTETKRASFFQRTFLGGVQSKNLDINFVDKEALLAGIADIRNDTSATNWLVARFVGEKKSVKLELAAKGNNGIEEMMDCFSDDHIMYGLLRNEELVDRSTTIKFYYFKWVGPNVPPATKGNIGVMTGAVNSLFSPFHDDIEGSILEDMMQVARKKIKNLS